MGEALTPAARTSDLPDRHDVRRTGLERFAEVEVGEAPEETAVLDEHRVVHSELLAGLFELLLGRARIAHDEPCRVGRDLEEEDEGREREDRDETDSPHGRLAM